MEKMNSWEWFIGQFEQMSRIDLTAYKRPQMERRINSFMRSAGTEDYQQFLKLLAGNKSLYQKFIEHLTINVSEFFRNTGHWEVLEREIVPLMLRERSSLKIWSAGCSTGEEPYSLAMMFQEKFPSKVESILATDLDDEVLEKAGIGLYTEKAIQTLPAAYLKKYFSKEGEFFRINDGMKRQIRFQRHDLLKDHYPQGIDLILCRNVVIYFTEETKQKLYRKFADALRPGGVLFIGSTEQIFQARDIGFKSIATFFYQKM